METGVAMAFSTPRKLRTKVCTKSISDNARKGEMLFWLDKHGKRCSSDMTKAELYDLIKMHKQQYETFVIGCLLAEHGHTVIRLPPYHPDLNPIEKIWSIVKTRIAAKMLLLSCEMFSNWQSRILPL